MCGILLWKPKLAPEAASMRLLGPGEYAAMVANVAKDRSVGISTVTDSLKVLF
jgi:hypothetical protein